ncbi:hypothetical protein [Phenylobacterium sp.]|uniref:hypothetical protein n=1 Tax=Phenylobacterium sp. TaxID=1871053 RepID=UPI003BACE737
MRQTIARIGVNILITVVAIPVLLTAIKIDPWLIVCVSVAAAVLIHLWGIAPHPERTWRKMMWPIVVMIVGGIVFAAGATWYYVAHPKHAQATAVAAKASPKLLIQCDTALMPRVMPPSGRFNSVSLAPIDPTSNPGGYGFHTGTPNARIDWGREFFPAFRCEVINYGPEPLKNASVEFSAVFRKAVHKGNITEQGDEILRRPWLMNIPRLGIGEAEKFEVYLYNLDPDVVPNMMMPNRLTAQRIGSSETETFKMDRISDQPFTIFAAPPPSPPAEEPSPPSPSDIGPKTTR